MATSNYQFYTARDFALDEGFQQWVLHPDVKNNYFWTEWLTENPEKAATVNTAIHLVKSVKFRNYQLPETEKDALWDNIWDSMEEDNTETGYQAPAKPWKNTWKYAAAVVIGMLSVLLWFQKRDATPSFAAHTELGQTQQLVLPDSSEVTLNANSNLVYAENKAGIREVWIKGEAYFHVKHTQDDKRFVVHTYDDVSVEVLGTRFNVNNFGDRIMVVLQQGSIKLGIKENGNSTQTQLYLKPGELLVFNKLDGNFTKTKVKTEQYISWALRKLTMENYTLKDANLFIQRVFGKNLIINDPTLLEKKISGSMPIEYDLNTMLSQFGEVFQVKFKHKNGKIWVMPKSKSDKE